jgi:hypothetical protein
VRGMNQMPLLSTVRMKTLKPEILCEHCRREEERREHRYEMLALEARAMTSIFPWILGIGIVVAIIIGVVL